MSIPIKSPQDYYNSIINSISVNADNGIATYPHSSAYDIFVKPLGDALYDTNILMHFIYASRSLEELQKIVLDTNYRIKLQFALNITKTNTDLLISGAIDNLASNWNEYRKQPAKSRGFVRMYFNSSTIPAIGQFTVKTDSDLVYITTTTFTSATVPTYDAVRNSYFIDASIEAVETGSQYNVEAGTINISDTNIANLISISNTNRTYYGRELETDLEFIDRIKNSWRSRRQSTLGGLIDAVIIYPNVEDVAVVMPKTDLSVRPEKNAVDIYIRNSPVNVQVSTIYNINSSVYAYEMTNDELSYEMYPIPYYYDELRFKLLSCPLDSIVKVEAGTDGEVFGSLISPDDYSLVIDTTSSYAYSVKAHDCVVVQRDALTNFNYIKVTYNYDKQFYNMQNLNNKLNYAIIGADILYKKALPITVNMDVSVLQLYGYNLDDLKAVISSDVNIFFSGGTDSNGVQRLGQKLGSYIDPSDILDVILSVEGVDRVDLSTFEITIDGEVVDTRYTAPFNKYLIFGNITWIEYPL